MLYRNPEFAPGYLCRLRAEPPPALHGVGSPPAQRCVARACDDNNGTCPLGALAMSGETELTFSGPHPRYLLRFVGSLLAIMLQMTDHAFFGFFSGPAMLKPTMLTLRMTWRFCEQALIPDSSPTRDHTLVAVALCNPSPNMLPTGNGCKVPSATL